MKFVSYTFPDSPIIRWGVLRGDVILDGPTTFLHRVEDLTSVLGLLSTPQGRDLFSQPIEAIIPVHENVRTQFNLSEVRLTAPIPSPTTFRDFYAFEEHVQAARARRGLVMVPEWYDMPAFYFSNPKAIYGPDDVIPYPKYTQWLDFELEIAAVIGKTGIDIPAEQAESYIAGYTILNDWSARDIQRKEMAVGLGPAKGKDFATSLGPWLVTPDELEDRRSGKGYNLTLVARRNGQEISRGNWKTIYFSFSEMIARASQEVYLQPGDVIGSGTVGTGCILELGPENVGGWLQIGDVVELEIERLGMLRNLVGSPRLMDLRRSGHD